MLNHPCPLFDYGVLRNKQRGIFSVPIQCPPLLFSITPVPSLKKEGKSVCLSPFFFKEGVGDDLVSKRGLG